MFDKSMFMKKFEKKKKLDPNEKEAKLGVAKELSKQAGAMLGDKAKPKAKEMSSEMSGEKDSVKEHGLQPGLSDEDSKLEHSAGEDGVAEHTGSSFEGPEACDISPAESELSSEDLDKKIQKLMHLKKSKEPKADKGNPFA